MTCIPQLSSMCDLHHVVFSCFIFRVPPDSFLKQREKQLTSFGFFMFYLSSPPWFSVKPERGTTNIIWILRYFFCELARNLRRKSKIRDQKMLWSEKRKMQAPLKKHKNRKHFEKKRRSEIEKCGGNRKSEKMQTNKIDQKNRTNFCTEVCF